MAITRHLPPTALMHPHINSQIVARYSLTWQLTAPTRPADLPSTRGQRRSSISPQSMVRGYRGTSSEALARRCQFRKDSVISLTPTIGDDQFTIGLFQHLL